MSLSPLCCALCLALVSASALHGQIAWGAPQPVSGPSDISTAGSYFDAVKTQPGNVTPYSVGGIAFHAFTVENYTSDHKIAMSGPVGGGADGDPKTSSADYDNMLKGCAYVSPGQMGTVTLEQLHPGDKYQVQVWQSEPGPRSTVLSGEKGNVTLKSRQFVLGTFVATGDRESFTFAPDAGAPYGEINAIMVRDLTAVP